MTEQEKLQRAKDCIDSLANGLNPLDGTPVPEQDIVNNVKISRCLFFVSNVLRKQLDGHEPKETVLHYGRRKAAICTVKNTDTCQWNQL